MGSAPTDLAYAAGVIDSDGYIGVHKNLGPQRRGDAGQAVYAPRVIVKQVTPQAVELLSELFGGNRYQGKPTAQRGRPLHVWAVHSAAAVVVCRELLPYLRIKREQALNAIAVGEINSSGERRRFVIPDVIEGEPVLPLLEAARLAGRSDAVAYQSASLGNIPTMREGRRVFVPVSYVETWRDRNASASRRPDLTARLDALYERAKELNRVGV